MPEDPAITGGLAPSLKKLSMFNRWCTLTAFADRPPVPQCKSCWSFDHDTAHHPNDASARCRLCGSTDHNESKHVTDCAACPPVGDMDADKPPCAHNLKCINCHEAERTDNDHACDSRRCPVRLDKYGTAREREREQRPRTQPKTVTNGSAKRTSRKKKAASTAPTAPAPVTSPNRFGALAEPSVDNLQKALEAKGVKLTDEQAATALKTTANMFRSTQPEWQTSGDNGW